VEVTVALMPKSNFAGFVAMAAGGVAVPKERTTTL